MKVSLTTRFIFWTAIYRIFGFLFHVASAMTEATQTFMINAEKKLEEQEDETG